MPLDSIIRKGVAIADKQTKSVQPSVTHKQWVGQSLVGDPVFDPPAGVSRRCIVDKRVQMKLMPGSGQPVTISAVLTFLTPVPPQGTPGREEPIDPRDEIILDDGSTASIVFSNNGVRDPAMQRPFVLEVWMGSK